MLKGIKTHYVHIYRTWDMTIFGPEFEPKLQVFVYLLSGSLTGGSGGFWTEDTLGLLSYINKFFSILV
jgi:hypothetical protein